MTNCTSSKPGTSLPHFLTNTCRICLEYQSDIMSDDLKMITLTDQLGFSGFTSQKLLLKPSWPYNICGTCKINLTKAAQFREAILYTQQHLSSYLTTNNARPKYRRLLEVIRRYNKPEDHAKEVDESLESHSEWMDKKEKCDDSMAKAEVVDLDAKSEQEQDYAESEQEQDYADSEQGDVEWKPEKDDAELEQSDADLEQIAVKDDKTKKTKKKPKKAAGPRKRVRTRPAPKPKKQVVKSNKKCPYCTRTNPTPLHVQQHQSGPSKCNHEGCDNVSKDLISLHRHMRVHRDMLHRVACEICGQMVIPRTMRAHIKSHLSLEERQKISKHKCETCGKVFTTSAHLRVHNTQVHIKSREYQCEFCERSFMFPYELRWHRVKKHVDRLPESERPSMRCDCCDRLFLTKAALRCHLTFKATGNAAKCGFKKGQQIGGKPAALKEKMKHNEDGTWSCDFCDAKLPTRQELNSHRRLHSIICEICNRSFFSQVLFDKHIVEHANEPYDRPYHCQHAGCKCRFRKPYLLQIHNRFHTKERPYQCVECPAAFRSSGDLLKHKRNLHDEQSEVVHRNEPDAYECSECDKKFQLKQMLSIHIRNKHNKDSIYECFACKKPYKTIAMMRYHFKRCPERDPSMMEIKGDEIEFVDDSITEEVIVDDAENYDAANSDEADSDEEDYGEQDNGEQDYGEQDYDEDENVEIEYEPEYLDEEMELS